MSRRTHDHASTQRNVASDQLEGRQHGQVLLGRSDDDHLSVRSKQTEVSTKRHLRVIRGTDDQIQRPSVRLEILIPTRVSGDKVGSTELEGVFLFTLRVGDGGDVGTEGLGEQEGEMTESTDSDDTDVYSGTGTVGDQRVVDRDTTAWRTL